MSREAATIDELDREGLRELLAVYARNWLAHDGCWFLAAENRMGLQAAIELDTEAWREFTGFEAWRILRFLGLQPGGGIPALVRALGFRLYACVNRQAVVEADDRRLIFGMVECRVQEARLRKGLPDFPCRPVGEIEYAGFARTIDPRIETRCLSCPPGRTDPRHWCLWEFTLP